MKHLFFAFFLLLSACTVSGEKYLKDELNPTSDSDKILIVYLSRTNNTKAIAEIIHKNVGGTLVALELEKPYPENYLPTVQQVVKEKETDYLPPLKTKIDSLQNHEVAFVGFPTWEMKLPPPVKNFLKPYDLSEKTVIPFHTKWRIWNRKRLLNCKGTLSKQQNFGRL